MANQIDISESDPRVQKCLRKLNRAKKLKETERAHIDADEALLELISSLGLEKVTELYDSIDRWYS